MTTLFHGRDTLNASRIGAPSGPTWARTADHTVALHNVVNLPDDTPEWIADSPVTAFFERDNIEVGNDGGWSTRADVLRLTGVQIDTDDNGTHYRDRASFDRIVGWTFTEWLDEFVTETAR